MGKPEIRFKGYTDEWEQRKLGDVFKEYSEKNHTELPALTIIQGGGTVKREDSDRNLMYDKSNLSNYKMVRKDDFIVHLRSFEGGLEKSSSDGIISPAYHTFHGDVTDSRFYYPYFRSCEFIKHKLVPHVYGIRDGRSIDIDGMKTIEIPYTSIEEQRKIGDYLESIDDLITLHQRKCDEVKSLKKYMLQKMFPQNEQKVPEIRFEGFTEAWEQRKLSDIYDSIGNAFVGTATPYYAEQGHFYLESNNVKDGQINHNSEIFINDEFYEKQKDKWLHTGDMVMVQSGHVGHAAVIPEELDNTAAHALIMFRNPKEEIEPYFLNYEYQTDKAKKKIENITTGNTIKHILASDMQEFVVDVPNYEEQKVIASYFRNIDHLITLHQQKPIPHPNHPTIHTKHKGEEKYVRIRVNDRGKINRTANLRRFPVDIPGGFKDGGGSVGEFQIYSGAE